MRNFLNSISDPVFTFLEEKLIKVIMISVILLLLLFKGSLYLPLIQSLQIIQSLDRFIQYDLANAFISRDSTLITLAAVFIGIYFTAYTLLATLSSKSTFSILNKKHLSSLINYIKNAFLASFSYLILSLISPLLTKFNWYYSAISLILLVYMLLSALRFGLLIYLILKRDVDNFLDRIQEEQQDEIRTKRILNDLDNYLEEAKNERGKSKAKDISEMLKKRKDKQNNDPGE